MYYVSYGCSFISGPASFRTAWALQMIPAMILFCILLFLPESPRWLASKGRWEEAHTIVAHVNAKGEMQDPLVLAELDEVKEAVRIAEESQGISVFALFSPHMWRRTFIGCSAQMWQQLVSPSFRARSNGSQGWMYLCIVEIRKVHADGRHNICIFNGWVDWKH